MDGVVDLQSAVASADNEWSECVESSDFVSHSSSLSSSLFAFFDSFRAVDHVAVIPHRYFEANRLIGAFLVDH